MTICVNCTRRILWCVLNLLTNMYYINVAVAVVLYCVVLVLYSVIPVLYSVVYCYVVLYCKFLTLLFSVV